VVGGNGYVAGVLEGIFYHLLCIIVEDEVGSVHANAIVEAIIFLDAKKQLNSHIKVESN
jgi:hypothetical protein